MVKSVIATCSLWWGGDGEVCYSRGWVRVSKICSVTGTKRHCMD